MKTCGRLSAPLYRFCRQEPSSVPPVRAAVVNRDATAANSEGPALAEFYRFIADALSATREMALCEGAARERIRIAKIMDSPAAKSRPVLAWAIARSGELTAEQADEIFAIEAEIASVAAAMAERAGARLQ